MVELRRLTKYYAATCALADVSFEVGPGEVLALLGPNGSGKTTLLKCVAGLVKPSSGTVLLGGVGQALGLRRPPPAKAERGAAPPLSYLPQQVAFEECLTCHEVLDFYRRLRRLPPQTAELALADWKLSEVAGRRVRELSGGLIQRLGIAVALLPAAPVLLLDEPAAGLDPAGAISLRSALRELKAAGTAVLFSSHSLADVEAVADRVAIFLAGRLVGMETVETLRIQLRSASLEEIYLRYVDEANGTGGGAAERVPARAAGAR